MKTLTHTHLHLTERFFFFLRRRLLSVSHDVLRRTQLTYKQFLIWSMCQMTSLESRVHISRVCECVCQLSPRSVQHRSIIIRSNDNDHFLHQSLILRFVSHHYYYYFVPNRDADELTELVNWLTLGITLERCTTAIKYIIIVIIYTQEEREEEK